MTNHPNRSQRRVLKGNWMDNGYICDLAPRELHITIVDGKAHDLHMYTFPCGQPLSDARLTLDRWNYISAIGAVWEFHTSDSEIERVGGRSIFAGEPTEFAA